MISEKCEWVIQLPNWAAPFYAGGMILLMFALAALVFAMAWAILKNKRQPLKTYNFCKTIIQNPEFLGISVF